MAQRAVEAVEPAYRSRESVEPTFAELLAHLHRERYTGALTLHFLHGVPTTAERPAPTRIKLRRT